MHNFAKIKLKEGRGKSHNFRVASVCYFNSFSSLLTHVAIKAIEYRLSRYPTIRCTFLQREQSRSDTD